MIDKIKKNFDSVAYYLFGRRIRYNERWSYLFSTTEFKGTLTQANYNTEYYMYLAKYLIYAFLVSVLGVVVGLVLGVQLSPYFANIDTSLRVQSQLLLSVFDFLRSYTNIIVPIVFSITFGGIIFITVFLFGYLLPGHTANEREREIDKNLPYTTTLLYSASTGSSNSIRAINEVADSEDLYGEASVEFQKMRNYINRTNNDFITALKRVQKNTPSKEFASFLQNLENTINTGSSTDEFFRNQATDYNTELEQDLERFNSTLELTRTVLLGAITILILTNLVIPVLFIMGSGGGVMITASITYIMIPLMFISMSVIVSLLNKTKFSKETLQIQQNDSQLKPKLSTLFSKIETKQDEVNTIETLLYISNLIYKGKRKIKKIPILLRDHPTYTTIVTVPLSILFISVLVLFGDVNLTIQSVIDYKYSYTLIFVGIPVLLILLPISMFHEIKMRRRNEIKQQYKELLRKIETNNREGLSLLDTFEQIAKNEDNTLSREIRSLYNKTTWTGEMKTPIKELANTLKTPEITRSLQLVLTGNEITGEIKNILTISSQEFETSLELSRARKKDTSIIAFVTIAGFVALAVMSAYIGELGLIQIAERFQGLELGNSSTINPKEIPVETLQLLYFHQSISFSLFSGVFLGIIRSESATSGLKYSIAMLIITLLTFAFV